MAIDVDTFLVNYPEFQDAPESLIEAKLDEAQLQILPAIWNAGGDGTRDYTQMATFLYTADALFDSPFSRHMSRVDQGNDRQGVRSDASPYRAKLQELKRTVTSGWRVL